MLDQMDFEQDWEILDYVFWMYCYRVFGEQDGDVMFLGSVVDILVIDDFNFSQEDQQDIQIYEKYDNFLYGIKKKKEKMVSVVFMKKYIYVVKIIKFVLIQELVIYIVEEYLCLCSQDSMSLDIVRIFLVIV